jgi:predicted nucleotidyltransferase
VTLQQVRKVLSVHSEKFRRAYVFGSVARGEADEASDVDVVLVRETQREFFDRIRDVFDLVFALGRADMLIYTPQELAELTGEEPSFFLQNVVREGVCIEGTQPRS